MTAVLILLQHKLLKFFSTVDMQLFINDLNVVINRSFRQMKMDRDLFGTPISRVQHRNSKLSRSKIDRNRTAVVFLIINSVPSDVVLLSQCDNLGKDFGILFLKKQLNQSLQQVIMLNKRHN